MLNGEEKRPLDVDLQRLVPRPGCAKTPYNGCRCRRGLGAFLIQCDERLMIDFGKLQIAVVLRFSRRDTVEIGAAGRLVESTLDSEFAHGLADGERAALD